MNRPTVDVRQRFLAMVDQFAGVDPKHPELGNCWRWLGLIQTGYGRFRYKGGPKVAHRVSYELFVGDIPDGLKVLHRCEGRPWCVNPQHVRPGTQKENVAECAQQGRRHIRLGASVNTSKLTADQIPVIFERFAKGELQVELARFYGIKPSSMCKLLHREHWKHIPIDPALLKIVDTLFTTQ